MDAVLPARSAALERRLRKRRQEARVRLRLAADRQLLLEHHSSDPPTLSRRPRDETAMVTPLLQELVAQVTKLTILFDAHFTSRRTSNELPVKCSGGPVVRESPANTSDAARSLSGDWEPLSSPIVPPLLRTPGMTAAGIVPVDVVPDDHGRHHHHYVMQALQDMPAQKTGRIHPSLADNLRLQQQDLQCKFDTEDFAHLISSQSTWLGRFLPVEPNWFVRLLGMDYECALALAWKWGYCGNQHRPFDVCEFLLSSQCTHGPLLPSTRKS